MAISFVQTNTLFQAGSGNILGATILVLTNFTDIYGNILTFADFGDKGYGTCEPDTTNEEAFTFTGVVANANGTFSLTGVKSALAKNPYTETPGMVRQHAGGSRVVITDSAVFYSNFAQNNQSTLPVSVRLKKRVINTVQSATPIINTDVTDVANIIGLAQAITSMTTNLTGTPNAYDTLFICITDNGVGRAITWGGAFEPSGNIALPVTTIAGQLLTVGFLWNTVTNRWRCEGFA